MLAHLTIRVSRFADSSAEFFWTERCEIHNSTIAVFIDLLRLYCFATLRDSTFSGVQTLVAWGLFCSNAKLLSSNCVVSLHTRIVFCQEPTRCRNAHKTISLLKYTIYAKDTQHLLYVRQSACHCLPSYTITYYNWIAFYTVFCWQLQ